MDENEKKSWVLVFVIAFATVQWIWETMFFMAYTHTTGEPLEGVDIDMFELEKQRIIVN